MAAQIADLGGIVSLHDFHSILAFAALGVKVLAHLKVDCGFGRMGLQEADWPQAFETIRKSPDIHLVGLYGHFGQVEDKAEVAKQMRRFNRAVDMSSSFGFRDLETMVASSRVAIGYPNCILNSVNIGRGLYGMLEGKWSEQFRQSKPLRILYAEVIQTKLLLKGMRPGYAEEPCNSDINVAILNCGFTHGLSRKAHGTPVLIHGAEAKTIGMRSTEHTVVDITGIPDVNVGDKAVVVGEQSGAKISDEKFSEASGIPLIEFYNRIGGRVDRVYVNRFSA
jgi:alanine racemase